MDLISRKELIAAEFEKLYYSAPSIISRAPGRVDLMGSHTDYNMGYVMTMTIDRDTWIAAHPRDDRIIRLQSLNLEGAVQFSLDDIQYDHVTPWSNYLRGIAKVLQEAGHRLRGFDGVIHSTVPFGSGLSSSAALEMATTALFADISNFSIDPVEMALVGQKAENSFVGVNTGILDQYTSALGQAKCAMKLDCRNLTSNLVEIADGIVIVICNTKAERNLLGSEYDDRRAQCEAGVAFLKQFYPSIKSLRDVSLAQFEQHEAAMPAVVAKRCRFILEENQRVIDLARALGSGDRPTLRSLFSDSYKGARDLFEIGAPEMEAMIQAMNASPGIIAARQAGGGFGGCMVALADQNHVDQFADYVSKQYRSATNIVPDIYQVSASAGAGIMPVGISV